PASRVGLVAGLIVAAPLIAGGIWWMTRPKDSVSNNNGGATEQTANQRAPAPLALNEREQMLPASRVLKVVFQSTPPAPMRPPGPLRLQLGLFGRRGIEKDYRPLTDGDPGPADSISAPRLCRLPRPAAGPDTRRRRHLFRRVAPV